MENLIDPEELLSCPYDSSHRVRRNRMNFHLVRCRKSKPQSNLIPCDFNASHLIAEPELQYHHSICSDRKKIEIKVVQAAHPSSKFQIPKVELDDQHENWDNMNHQSYKPDEAIQGRDVLRNIMVESSTKKKDFRMAERFRLSQLNKGRVEDEQVPLYQAIGLPPHGEVSKVKDEKGGQRVSQLKQILRDGANKVFAEDDGNK